MKFLVWSASALFLLAVPALASAADGYVTANVTLRAGPDVDYPRITVIPAGTPLAIQGCTTGWVWCDVVVFGNRGWVAGDFIQYNYNNQRVMLPAYGARIGVPIVSFVIGNYWGRYYRDRPFYQNRSHWYNRPMRSRPPPPAHQGSANRRPTAGIRASQSPTRRSTPYVASGDHARANSRNGAPARDQASPAPSNTHAAAVRPTPTSHRQSTPTPAVKRPDNRKSGNDQGH